MYKSIYRGKQRILSASEMSKTKNSELLVQRIFHVIQYSIGGPLVRSRPKGPSSGSQGPGKHHWFRIVKD